MRKQINFVVPDTNQLTERVIDYFNQFDLKLIEQKDGLLKFGHSSSYFEAWKSNPLKWESEISVLISGDKILADFYVDTEAQMNTMEEEKVWETFMENFQSCLINGVGPESNLNSTITDNRKSRLSYMGWAILGALTGGLLGGVFNNLTNIDSFLSFILIPVFATIFLKWRISYTKSKVALYHME